MLSSVVLTMQILQIHLTQLIAKLCQTVCVLCDITKITMSMISVLLMC